MKLKAGVSNTSAEQIIKHVLHILYNDESLFGTKTSALHLIMKLKEGVSNSKVELMKLDE